MLAWPLVVIAKVARTGGTALGGRSNSLTKRLEGVGSKERKEAKMTPIFLAELGESPLKRGNMGEFRLGQLNLDYRHPGEQLKERIWSSEKRSEREALIEK